MNVLPTARFLLKTALEHTPMGPPLRTWYRQRRAVQELQRWTAGDQPAWVFYSQFVKPGSVCFDIGANRGNRAKVFRRLGAKVVAVEPQSSCMKILRDAYGSDPGVTLIQAACGSSNGKAVMRVCEADVLSSLSEEWITAVSQSGRFVSQWAKEEPCTLITVDELIQRYGTPSFIKIDVEGYELNVLKGMTGAVPALSFEFTPECFATAVACVDHLCGLGMRQFNVSWGESLQLLLDGWIEREELIGLLNKYREDRVIFGDVYARLAA